MKYSEVGFCMNVVQVEIRFQVIMMWVSYLCVLNFCSVRLLGILKMKYVMKNRLLVKLNILGESLMLWFICKVVMLMLLWLMKVNRQYSIRKGSKCQVILCMVFCLSCLLFWMVFMFFFWKLGVVCVGGWFVSYYELVGNGLFV